MKKVMFVIAALLLLSTSVYAQPATPSFVKPLFDPVKLAAFLTASTPYTAAGTMVMFQVPTNPNIVEFTSPDHLAVVDGSPTVSRYDLQIFPAANTTGNPTRTFDMGKPTSTTTLVTYNGLRTAMAGLPNGQFAVKVLAVGPGGTSAASAASDPFNQQGPPVTTSKPVVR